MLTVNRLRTWFVVTGLFTAVVYGTLTAAGVSELLEQGTRSVGGTALGIAFAGGCVLYNLAFVFTGIRLRGLLVTHPHLIARLVKVNMALSLLSLNLLCVGINWYLLRQLGRLALNEQQAQSKLRAPGFAAMDRR